MSKYMDGKIWYKARMGFAPVWVADPNGECHVQARWGFLGEFLLDIAAGIAIVIMRCSEDAAGFPFHITDKDWKG